MKSVARKQSFHTTTTHTPSMLQVHYHNLHELYYLKEGSATYYIGNEIYHIQQGDFVFIPQGVLHKTNYEPNIYTERIHVYMDNLVFTRDVREIQDEMFHFHVVRVDPSQLSYLENILARIKHEAAGNDTISLALYDLYIKELLLLLQRHKQDYKPILSEVNQLIYDVSQYISDHIQQPLSLKTLSRKFGVNEYYLSRKFKASVGIGINEYLTYARITKAEQLLSETDLPMTKVAEQCGFADSNYFSTVFKRVTGISPLKYRNSRHLHS